MKTKLNLSTGDSVLCSNINDLLLPDAGDGVVPVGLSVPHRGVGGDMHALGLAVPHKYILLQVWVELNLWSDH